MGDHQVRPRSKAWFPYLTRIRLLKGAILSTKKRFFSLLHLDPGPEISLSLHLSTKARDKVGLRPYR